MTNLAWVAFVGDDVDITKNKPLGEVADILREVADRIDRATYSPTADEFAEEPTQDIKTGNAEAAGGASGEAVARLRLA
jgi:hypothetical protein